MTMPYERTWAVTNTREFLYELLDPKKTPRIPKSVRLRAGRLLKHFPTNLDMENVVEEGSAVFGSHPRPEDRSHYTIPHKWVVLKIQSGEKTSYKVMGSWYGGYLYGDRWRLNSGICRVEKEEGSRSYVFHGYSGSCYLAHQNNYGTHLEAQGVIQQMQQLGNGISIEVMPAETDWLTLIFDNKTIGAPNNHD